MRSAKFLMSPEVLFRLIGIENFDAKLADIRPVHSFGQWQIEVSVFGEDERLPDNDKYPEVRVVAMQTRVESHFELVDYK